MRFSMPARQRGGLDEDAAGGVAGAASDFLPGEYVLLERDEFPVLPVFPADDNAHPSD
jgi:hypothetical protein